MALHAALERNDVEIVRLLLSHGADPNSPAFENPTALNKALLQSNPSVDIVRLLVEHGAHINCIVR